MESRGRLSVQPNRSLEPNSRAGERGFGLRSKATNDVINVISERYLDYWWNHSANLCARRDASLEESWSGTERVNKGRCQSDCDLTAAESSLELGELVLETRLYTFCSLFRRFRRFVRHRDRPAWRHVPRSRADCCEKFWNFGNCKKGFYGWVECWVDHLEFRY